MAEAVNFSIGSASVIKAGYVLSSVLALTLVARVGLFESRKALLSGIFGVLGNE